MTDGCASRSSRGHGAIAPQVAPQVENCGVEESGRPPGAHGGAYAGARSPGAQINRATVTEPVSACVCSWTGGGNKSSDTPNVATWPRGT